LCSDTGSESGLSLSMYTHIHIHIHTRIHTYLAGGLGGLAAARTTKGELGGMRDANDPSDEDADDDEAAV
jgi:hypothetical protein